VPAISTFSRLTYLDFEWECTGKYLDGKHASLLCDLAQLTNLQYLALRDIDVLPASTNVLSCLASLVDVYMVSKGEIGQDFSLCTQFTRLLFGQTRNRCIPVLLTENFFFTDAMLGLADLHCLTQLSFGDLGPYNLTDEDHANLYKLEAALSSRTTQLVRKPAGACHWDFVLPQYVRPK